MIEQTLEIHFSRDFRPQYPPGIPIVAAFSHVYAGRIERIEQSLVGVRQAIGFAVTEYQAGRKSV